MRITMISLLLFLLTTSVVIAGETLQAVGCDPYQALLNTPLVASGKGLVKAPPSAGTHSPQALLAKFSGKGFTFRAALDADSAAAQRFTCLRLAFSEAAPFAADTTVELTPLYATNTQFAAQFGPQTFNVPLNGRTLPVTVAGSYTQDNSGGRLTLALATALQGACAFAEQTHAVRLVSGDNSLQPGSPFPPTVADIAAKGFHGGDTVVVDTGDGTFSNSIRAFYGHPLQVDGHWYTLALTPDASAFIATPFTGATGSITMNQGRWEAILLGKTHLLHLTGDAGTFTIPADQYRVYLLPDTRTCNAQGFPPSSPPRAWAATGNISRWRKEAARPFPTASRRPHRFRWLCMVRRSSSRS